MANLGQKNGIYLARFRYQSREYKRSLKTTDRKSAEAAMHRVEDALHRLSIRVITLPAGVDAGDFIVSGGVRPVPIPEPDEHCAPLFGEAVEEYTQNLAHLAVLNQSTIRTHLRTLGRKLGEKSKLPINLVEPRDLEAVIQARLKERSATTVSKERVTFGQFFAWAVSNRYLTESPAENLTRVKPSGDLPAFRTYGELETTIERGGLSPREILALWDALFLTPEEIAEILKLVRERSRYDVSVILHSIPAYTGMRRGEVLRLRWSDVEFDADTIIARSRKQSRQMVETARRIDLHPELKKILLEWRVARPAGQFVVCDPNSLRTLTSREASTRFFQPLVGTNWCLCRRRDWFKIGYHTYRHSFASNLASLGIDQRVIDEWMGHQTEGMRKRYRHLFPKTRRSAIESFSFSNKETEG